MGKGEYHEMKNFDFDKKICYNFNMKNVYRRTKND